MNLASFNTDNLFKASTNLFQQLGINLNSNTAEPLPLKDLLKSHYKHNETFKIIEKTYFIGRIDDTIFHDKGVDYSYHEALKQTDNNYDGLILFALELSKHPTRSEISELTRTFNRVSQKMPVALVLKYQLDSEAVISIAISERFKYKQYWRQGEKAGKVIILRDIHTKKTHAGHERILHDLVKPTGVTNYDQLHKLWLEVMDVNILNKKFFRELANWYFWAMHNVSFPDDIEKKKDVRNATNLIRLITRIIFIWFIKEKSLVPDVLFDKIQLESIVKDFSKNSKSKNYYNAILQNLFFGTLNQKMGERKFARDEKGNINVNRKEFGVKNIFRYADLLNISEKEALQLFKDVPFLNGGLFDCLDKRNEEGKDVYVDGFSRNSKKQAIIPDELFFGEEKEVNLNDIFGTKNTKYTAKGLFTLLESYKFTVAENTPLEEEVALDPELLGKVFENLLASYNPETKTTARKQTGSFYTPREIVNYMVDESLIEYLKTSLLKEGSGVLEIGKNQIGLFGNETKKGQLTLENKVNESPWKNKQDELDKNLRQLFSYESDQPFNDPKDVVQLIEAINHCKILDPACGSGAFPMGILHKMVHLLQKLDPENKLWKAQQKKKIVGDQIELLEKDRQAIKGLSDKAVRQKAEKAVESRLKEIDEIFESKNNFDDYARKLYLIENCIYGIDIQPIAAQISKLRFFISLIIDQNKQADKENLGIRSLPNLETKFVAANTLIGLEKPAQTLLRNPAIEQKENELKELRHKYFSTNTRKEKLQYQKQDKKLREEIAKMLEKDGWETDVAKQIVTFDPYDQNTFANWFDPEWMFGLNSGFDIVIGNPPYIKEYTFKEAFDGIRNSPYYQGKMDLWYLFACKNLDFTRKATGIVCFIATNNWTTNSGASKMRNKIISDATIHLLMDFGSYMIFESADIQTMVMIFKNNSKNSNYNFEFRRLVGNYIGFDDVVDLISNKQTEKTEYLNPKILKKIVLGKTLTFTNEISESILNKIKSKRNFLLDETTEVAQGIVLPQDFLNKSNQKKLGDNFKAGQGIFVLSNNEKKSSEFIKNEHQLIKPFYSTKKLHKWFGNSKNDEWIIYTDSKFKHKENIKPYPNIKRHLDRFQKVITSDNKPYGLHRAREEYFFKGEKIIVLRKCAIEPIFTYTNFDCYVSATFYVIKSDRINLKYLTGVLNSRLIAFWLRKKGKMQGNNYQLDKEPLLDVPIYNFDNTSHFELIVDFILQLKKQKDDSTFFESLINAMVYELYLPEEIKAGGAEVLKHLTKLPGIKEGGDEKNLKIIEKVYKELSDPKHPVSIALRKLHNIEEVNIIEGRK